MCSIHASLPHDDDDDDDNNNNSDDTMSVKIKPEAHSRDNWKLKENKTQNVNRNETKNKKTHQSYVAILFTII